MEKKELLTIMTPTFNRAKTLLNLYVSLSNQTSDHFIWLIIDDGSTDDTKSVVESFVQENKVKIVYHYQENSGKYVAHNVGAKMCKTELFLCVDSDDTLYPEAVEKIESSWKIIKNNKYIAGLVSPKDMNGNSYFIDPPQTGRLMDLYNCGCLFGESALVFKSNVLRKYSFPVINSEKFMSEDVLYNQIDQKYEFYIINEYFYRAEYQDDGLTKNIKIIHWKNPESTLLMYRSNAAYQTNFTKAIKSYGCYLAWKRCRKINDVGNEWIIPLKVKFFGVFLFFHYLRLFKNQAKELNYIL